MLGGYGLRKAMLESRERETLKDLPVFCVNTLNGSGQAL